MAKECEKAEKIKGLLSSFVHTSTDEKSAADLSSLSGKKSQISQKRPYYRDKTAYVKRLKSFTPVNWFAKPNWLSPPVCCQYGWQNVAYDMLQCVTCKVHVSGKMPSSFQPNIYNECCKKLEDSLQTAHHPYCPWLNNPCPETYLSVELPELKDVKAQLLLTVKHNRNLPRFNDDIFEKLDVKKSSLERLRQSLGLCDKVDTDVFMSACVLVLCGWQVARSAPKSQLLTCSYCSRECGLWNCISLQNDESSEDSDDDTDLFSPLKRKMLNSSMLSQSHTKENEFEKGEENDSKDDHHSDETVATDSVKGDILMQCGEINDDSDSVKPEGDNGNNGNNEHNDDDSDNVKPEGDNGNNEHNDDDSDNVKPEGDNGNNEHNDEASSEDYSNVCQSIPVINKHKSSTDLNSSPEAVDSNKVLNSSSEKFESGAVTTSDAVNEGYETNLIEPVKVGKEPEDLKTHKSLPTEKKGSKIAEIIHSLKTKIEENVQLEDGIKQDVSVEGITPAIQVNQENEETVEDKITEQSNEMESSNETKITTSAGAELEPVCSDIHFNSESITISATEINNDASIKQSNNAEESTSADNLKNINDQQQRESPDNNKPFAFIKPFTTQPLDGTGDEDDEEPTETARDGSSDSENDEGDFGDNSVVEVIDSSSENEEEQEGEDEYEITGSFIEDDFEEEEEDDSYEVSFQHDRADNSEDKNEEENLDDEAEAPKRDNYIIRKKERNKGVAGNVNPEVDISHDDSEEEVEEDGSEFYSGEEEEHQKIEVDEASSDIEQESSFVRVNQASSDEDIESEEEYYEGEDGDDVDIYENMYEPKAVSDNTDDEIMILSSDDDDDEDDDKESENVDNHQPNVEVDEESGNANIHTQFEPLEFLQEENSSYDDAAAADEDNIGESNVPAPLYSHNSSNSDSLVDDGNDFAEEEDLKLELEHDEMEEEVEMQNADVDGDSSEVDTSGLESNNLSSESVINNGKVEWEIDQNEVVEDNEKCSGDVIHKSGNDLTETTILDKFPDSESLPVDPSTQLFSVDSEQNNKECYQQSNVEDQGSVYNKVDVRETQAETESELFTTDSEQSELQSSSTDYRQTTTTVTDTSDTLGLSSDSIVTPHEKSTDNVNESVDKTFTNVADNEVDKNEIEEKQVEMFEKQGELFENGDITVKHINGSFTPSCIDSSGHDQQSKAQKNKKSLGMKRKKKPAKILFNPFTEHRDWCPWIQEKAYTNSTTEQNGSVSDTLDRNHHHTTRVPGWKELVQSIIPEASPEKINLVTIMKMSPPFESLKRIRSIFHNWESPQVKVKMKN